MKKPDVPFGRRAADCQARFADLEQRAASRCARSVMEKAVAPIADVQTLRCVAPERLIRPSDGALTLPTALKR